LLARNLLPIGFFGISYRVDQPSSMITLMRLTTASAAGEPQRFLARHGSRRTGGAESKPADVIADSDPFAPRTKLRDKRAIASRDDAATGIEAEAAQIAPLAKAENPVVLESVQRRTAVVAYPDDAFLRLGFSAFCEATRPKSRLVMKMKRAAL
jgi:hypothetical protein